MKTNVKAILGLTALLLIFIFSPALASAASDYSTLVDTEWENFKFVKNIMIWFMLMLVAFLMIFIKKYEWSVALAVLLSAAGSFIVYLGINDFLFGAVWNQDLLLMGVICAITVVIAIGCFLGILKMWQYLLVGLLFAPAFIIIEQFMVYMNATDPGGSILVHMCAAYFGLGVALAIRDKRAFDEPMYTTTHSISFVWLAAMLLWMLWPAFITALLPLEQVLWATMTCYLAGIGSILSAWVVCTVLQKKVNPLIYTYAMLAGPVAIGSPLLMVGPWGALLIGLLAGAISAVSFIYLQSRLCKMLGVLDVMGVHNLHGVAGWVGVVISAILLISVGSPALAAANLLTAAGVLVITLVLGIVVGLIVKFTRGSMSDEMMFSDDADFIKSEAP